MQAPSAPQFLVLAGQWSINFSMQACATTPIASCTFHHFKLGWG